MKVREIIENNEKWIPNQNYNEISPEITVILPTFRRAQSGFFENAVLSVINQTYTKWELIIVDDASTDGTEQLIQEFMKTDARINCIRHIKNVGLPAISEYEGYIRGRGEYFAFIFDDNVWEKDYLFKTLLLMKKKSVKASYGLAKGFANIKNNDFILLGEKSAFGLQNLAMSNFIANGSVILHKDVIEDVGLYDPHLTLTRLCDWDLWRRISKKYEFLQTDINATSEMGVCLSDSLGNSYMMNIWCALERMSQMRDEKLRPVVYEENDIVEFDDTNTIYYRDIVDISMKRFKQKFWYNRTDERYKNIAVSKQKKRILVIHDGMTASVTLYWERLFEQSGNFVVKFHHGSVNKSELIFADAVIICRTMMINEYLAEWCQKLKIPCYYFIDDNFIELAKEFNQNSDIVRVANATNRTVLKNYEAIIVSTNTLKVYFEDHLLHNNVLLMEPLIDVKKTDSVCQNLHEKELRVGFLGGVWRQRTFDEYVLPALKRLSKRIKVIAYIPLLSTDALTRKKYEEIADDNLSIEFIERTLSLDDVLMCASKKQIDILVHCGEEISNNEFKTENALLNALQIGAVLITSNEQPYVNSPVRNEAFFIADNTVDGWYEKFKEIAEVDVRKVIFEKMKKYCYERYSFEKSAEDFISEMSKKETISYYEYLERAEILLNSSMAPNVNNGNEKSFHNVRLGIGTLIKKDISYNITCTVDNLREIGVLFGSFDLSYGGKLKVSLLERKNLLFEKWFPLSYFVRDDWTFIEVGSISGMKGKIVTLRFECEYEMDSAKVGFFENLDKRSFWYKVCNKLGHHIKGLDALVTECH